MQAYIGLGNARYSDRDHDRTYWYLQALEVLGEHGDASLLAQAYSGLGNFECSERRNEKGLNYYNQALQVAPRSMRETINQKIRKAEGFIKSFGLDRNAQSREQNSRNGSYESHKRSRSDRRDRYHDRKGPKKPSNKY